VGDGGEGRTIVPEALVLHSTAPTKKVTAKTR